MKNSIKKILLWLLIFVMSVLGLCFLPSFGAFLCLLAVSMLLPISKWQTFLKKHIHQKVKTTITILLCVIGLVTAPLTVSSNVPDDNSPVTNISQNENQNLSSTTTTTITKTTKSTTNTSSVTTTITTQHNTTTRLTTTKAPTNPTTKKTTAAPPAQSQKITYILNISSKKFHQTGCRHVKNMNEENRDTFTGNRNDLIAEGYDPCGTCKP